MKEPSISESRKAQKENNMRRAEAEYLRFLRTKEKPENFATLKIIGKGAFGEVKLVQRKNDGKIYALKSLVKSEMVGINSKSILESTGTNLNSLRKISWLTSGQNVISLQNLIALGLSSCTPLSRTIRFCTC